MDRHRDLLLKLDGASIEIGNGFKQVKGIALEPSMKYHIISSSPGSGEQAGLIQSFKTGWVPVVA